MSGRLPNFSRPPVTEVVLSATFASPANLGTPQLVIFWRDQLADKLPRIEEQPPYDAPIERYDRGASPAPGLGFQILDRPPSPRLWCLSEDGGEMVQLQPGWIARNWRGPDDEPYPRYPAIRGRFERDLRSLDAFLHDIGSGSFVATQCEVTYVNHVRPAEGVWTNHGDLHKAFRQVSPPAPGVLPPPEEMRYQAKYVMGEVDDPAGRLYVSAEPAYTREDRLPIFVLSLTARGRPLGAGIEGVLGFADRARGWIVSAFVDITTPEMHAVWGLEDD